MFAIHVVVPVVVVVVDVVAASWLFVCMWDRWFQLHVWLLACVNVCL